MNIFPLLPDFDFGLSGALGGLIQAIFALVTQILEIITAALYGAIGGLRP